MAKRKPRPDWSSLLIAEAPCGVLCIMKEGRDYFEFPAGKRHANDRTPCITVLRETREETGVRLRAEQVALVGNDQQFNHYTHNPFQMMVYSAKLTDSQIANHHTLSKEGEKVGILTWPQLNALGDKFSPFHRWLGEKYGLWRTK
jgi:8-oxo-dGTP pyrophosphatase MutT (NUDIX family)